MGLNTNTVLRAVRQLRDEGLLELVQAAAFASPARRSAAQSSRRSGARATRTAQRLHPCPTRTHDPKPTVESRKVARPRLTPVGDRLRRPAEHERPIARFAGDTEQQRLTHRTRPACPWLRTSEPIALRYELARERRSAGTAAENFWKDAVPGLKRTDATYCADLTTSLEQR